MTQCFQGIGGLFLGDGVLLHSRTVALEKRTDLINCLEVAADSFVGQLMQGQLDLRQFAGLAVDLGRNPGSKASST